jgi:DNA-binding transcriptional ArsR family regulator
MVNNSELDAVFAALGDPTRRRIVERLSRGRLTVGELASEFAMSQPAVSKHIKVLERSGLLAREIQGRVHHCRLDPEAMATAAGWLDTQRHFWEAAFGRLDTYFARNPDPERKQ